MNTTRLIQARRLFASEFVSREQNRANARRWVRCVRQLGPKWIALSKTKEVQQ